MSPSHTGPNVALPPITRDEWLAMLARCTSDEREPAIRRGDRRHGVDGIVKLALINTSRGSFQTAVRTVPLLQVSDSGIMIRSHAELAPDTVVSMQVYLDEDGFALLGRVIHCTETIGGFKVGIQLAFLEDHPETT